MPHEIFTNGSTHLVFRGYGFDDSGSLLRHKQAETTHLQKAFAASVSADGISDRGCFQASIQRYQATESGKFCLYKQ